MKKICMIFCGGTVTMKRNTAGLLTPFYGAEDVLKFVPQLKSVAQLSVVKFANVDSSNVDPLFWTKLAETIASLRKEYDGFVITHGTDTMAYTASAMSYALRHIEKPIIFTGAQKPVEDIPSDAAGNLINATIVASKFSVGVAIVFGSKILQGNRATKVSESSLDAFDSPMVPLLGEIALEPVVTGHTWTAPGGGNKFHATFDPHVIVVQVTPGLSRFHLKSILHSNVKGLIFEAYGPGNMPTTLIPFLRDAQKQGVVIIVLSQCRRGITRMQLYEVGQHALDAGAIPGGDMTVEAAVGKLMWILSRTRDVKKVRTLMQTNIAGELTLQKGKTV